MVTDLPTVPASSGAASTWHENELNPWTAAVRDKLTGVGATNGTGLRVRSGAAIYVDPGWANMADFGGAAAAWPATSDAAIAAAIAAGHRRLYFPMPPNGDAYYVSNPITVDDAFALEGYATNQNVNSQPTIKGSGSLGTDPVIQGSADARNVTIRRLSITGEGSGSANIGIYAPIARYWVIEDVYIDQCGSHGIKYDSSEACWFNRVFVNTVCQVTTGISTWRGAVHITGSDAQAINCEFGIGGNYTTDTSGWRVACVWDVTNGALTDNVFELSENGLVLPSAASNGWLNRIIGNRADLNRRNGFVIEGEQNIFVGNLSWSNSQLTHNTYDGFVVSGRANEFVANVVASVDGAGTLMRYGFNDSANVSSGNHEMANVYTLNRGRSLGTALYNVSGVTDKIITMYGRGSPEGNAAYAFGFGCKYMDLATGVEYHKKSAMGTTTGWTAAT